jgi:probable phosphoglycerate mutase
VGELLWLGVLRHGQSLGNVAAERAETTGAEVIDLSLPDPEVPLSAVGEQQAQAVGWWLASLPAHDRPDVVISSTYRRAFDTAQLAMAQLVEPPAVRRDERLRDRELGILDRLTRAGVAARVPEEDARRRFIGKFYYRPPGGESWADVALRLRSLLTDLRRDHAGQRVLLTAHEAIVFLLRYLVEGLTVPQLTELAHRPLGNAGLTSWHQVDGQLRLAGFDDDGPVRTEAPQTRQAHV